MPWCLKDLQHFALAAGITNVTLNDGMTPGEVLDLSSQADLSQQQAFQVDNS
jgi:hypothetical protein